ncbi:MAG: hypothetical protein JSW25_07260 [Thermoplasmata archaeon]|nr:MAG: hypothetical protein JSW25_07260 [Thermoplasmata archaeon]
MRARTAIALMATFTMLAMVAFPATAQDPSHGGSMTNTHNDLYIVQEDAQNPQGIEARYGELFVKETISFSNDDPETVPDYGIVYADPTFSPDPSTPIVVKYTHDYTIVNYTLQLFNLADGWIGNLTGYTGTSATLQPGIDLHPNEPEQPHPRVNTSYLWQVWAVSAQDRQIVYEFGGETTTEIYNDTVFDWSDLPIAELGDHHYEANQSALAQLTISSIMEPHPSLSQGWYRFRIADQVFEYGVNLTIELRYRGQLIDRKVTMNKLIFTPRIIHVDVYSKSKMEILMFNAEDGKGDQIPPTAASSGPGDPTSFTYESTFSLVVREEGSESTDFGQLGRYALLGVLIVVLLFLVLWSGRGKRTTEDDVEEEDEETAELRAELEGRKAEVLAQMKALDQRHEDGEIGEGVYNRKRKALKARAVEVMRELEELDGAPPPPPSRPAPTGKLGELEEDKEEILERIRELDRLHEEGEVSDDTWKRKRKHLKAEAVEIMQEMAELEDGGEPEADEGEAEEEE